MVLFSKHINFTMILMAFVSIDYGPLSLDAGLEWQSGVRRSTRVRHRPLEHWRGERFVYGRIHDSKHTNQLLVQSFLLMSAMLNFLFVLQDKAKHIRAKLSHL
jgi:hypothetical protein